MFIQLRFSNPVPFIKRQESLTETVFISFSSINKFPKTLWRWRANASPQQIIWCNLSVSFLQNLQVEPPSNRPIMTRCFLTVVCPVKIATAVFRRHLLNLARSSTLFLHMKSLPCVWFGKSLQVQQCWYSVQFFIPSLAEHLGISRIRTKKWHKWCLYSKLIRLLIVKYATVLRHPNEGKLVWLCQFRENNHANRNQSSSHFLDYRCLKCSLAKNKIRILFCL
jgi:hypothetical protein